MNHGDRQSEQVSDGNSSSALRALQRVVDVKPHEVRALFWSCVYFFCLLASYFVLRPLREEVGIAEGTDKLRWFWTCSLLGMVIANPIFSFLVSRYPRKRFIPWVYRFFAANLAVFFALYKLLPPDRAVYIGRVFYVWLSVFNLFAISVFWGFMADIFRLDQGKRLFAFIGVGGTLGAIAGAWFTGATVKSIGAVQIFLVSIALLEVSVQCVFRLIALVDAREKTRATTESSPHLDLARSEHLRSADADASRPAGGSLLSGITLIFKMPYLQGICLYTIFYTLSASFLYLQQANIVHDSITDRNERTILFAHIDLWVNCLTLAMQLFATGRIVVMLGITFTLVAQPVLTSLGFAGLGFRSTLTMVVLFQVMFRAVNQGTAKPAREMLYTVVDREVKYKSKSFIDTFVYRTGDLVSVWSFAGLHDADMLAIPLSPIAYASIGIGVAWLVTGLLLGRKQEELAREESAVSGVQAAPLAEGDPA
jgi:AAA family ATP:ADP antiporter